GRISPKRIEVSLHDHSGAHIRELPDVIVNVDEDTTTSVATDGGSSSDFDDEEKGPLWEIGKDNGGSNDMDGDRSSNGGDDSFKEK
ncbi:MAG: hypothetical protein ABEI86_06115, partial [Halobacteriaceae archaeon]